MTSKKKTHVLQDEVQLEAVIKRVKRAQGQITGVIRMLEEGRSCEEVAHQMSAVGKAINTAAITLIAASFQECVLDSKTNNEENLKKLQKLFLSLA